MSLPGWQTRAVALAATSVTALAGVLVFAGPASAQAATTLSYDQTGAYGWTVPQGVRTIHIDAVGGSGGSYSNFIFGDYFGGAGAEVTADLPVTPGEVLNFHVGGNGGMQSAGANGGGAVPLALDGGGGGATDVRTSGDTLADRVLVAAGGGGFGAYGTAGAAGQAGSNGGACVAPAAQPGTDTAGGAGGGSCGDLAGQDGALGVGGTGGLAGGGFYFYLYGGGGGGGGYFGGGGGGEGGGAGGSNLVPADSNATQSLAPLGSTPYLHISYVTSVAAQVDVSTTDASLPADGTSTTTVTAVVTDQDGGAVPGDEVGFTSSDPGVGLGPVTDHGDGSYSSVLTASQTAGPVTITATDNAVDPAVIGSTQLTLSPLPQSVAFTSSAPTADVVGQSYTPAAAGGASGNPVTFSVAASTTGYGTDAQACSQTGGTFSFDHAGSCVIDADQAGNGQYAAAQSVSQAVAVGQAATTTTLRVGSAEVSATVAPVAPGAGTPTGTVTFAVDGQKIGTATVADRVATLDQGVAPGATRAVSATYTGDADFTGSSGSTARQDPTITGHLASGTAPTRYGWYRTAVTVSFTCSATDAPLTTPCPEPVRLSRSAAGQSVTATVLSADGGAATATVSGIDIDRAAPKVSISGIRNHATYRGSAPTARCVSRDPLSGTATCRLHRSTHGQVVHYTAVATDRAGNRARTSVRYRVLGVYLTGAAYRHGAFHVRAGHAYNLVVTTVGKTAPRYYNAAVAGRRPGPAGPLLHRAGTTHGLHVWTIPVTMSPGMARFPNWVIGLRTRHTMRAVRLHF